MSKLATSFLSGLISVRLWIAVPAAIAIFFALFVLPVALDAVGEGWALVGLAAVVVYFFARLVRYFLSRDEKSRMRGLLVALGALHLAGLVSYFTVPFSHQTGRSLAEEMYGVDFEVFPAILAFTWVLISVLVVLRYKTLERGGAASAFRPLSIAICILLAVFAVGLSSLVPPAIQVFSAFGAELPSPTLLVIAAGEIGFWWLVPALGAALAVVVIMAAGGRAARYAFDGQIALLVIANASLFVILDTLFLPYFKLCETVLETGFTRLHAAALLGHTDSALRFVSRGAPLNAVDESGNTPFYYAVARNHYALAKELAARGASVDTNTQRGATPLHAAAFSGGTEVVAWLLEKGARVAPVSNWGSTPLHSAASGGHVDTAVLLLERGADINAEDDEGRTPLDQALELKNDKVANVLIERGGIRSTKESRRLKAEQPKVNIVQVRAGSCGV